jgi:hypothetical protein
MRKKMPAKWQRFRVDAPDDFTPGMREALGREVTEFIRRRSEAGKDKNGKAFPKYSKSYKESLDFKNAGKTGKVDLTLSGDMLIALDVISHRRGSILIGYENGSEENAKADGNLRGTYGNSKPITGKARDFMGISEAQLNQLIRKVEDNY